MKPRPAYNEEDFIRDKLLNTSSIDYPNERVEVFLITDGCTDNTVKRAYETLKLPECRDLNIKLIEHKTNRGKVIIINEAVEFATGDIIALSDVSSLISLDAFSRIVDYFSDGEIGVVSSNYHVLEPGSKGEAAYWKYQREVKINEGHVGDLIGAHGAFYTFRKKLFYPLEADTINDDFILPMRIISQGYRGLYAEDINALELEHSDNKLDSKRRQRIAMGNFQQLVRLFFMLSPRFKSVAFMFGSGKALRVIVPYLLIISFIGSFWMCFFDLDFIYITLLQLFIYSSAIYTLFVGENSVNRLFRVIYYIIKGHANSLLGTSSYILMHWGSVSENRK